MSEPLPPDDQHPGPAAGFWAHVRAAFDDHRRMLQGTRHGPKVLVTLTYILTLGALVFGVYMAVVFSVVLATGIAFGVLTPLGVSSKLDGQYTTAAQYLIVSGSLTILAHGKRWFLVPMVFLFNARAREEGMLLFARTMVRGIVAIDFRRRAYEVGTVLLVASVLSELGAMSLANIPFGLASKPVFPALVTFLAIDTYLATFFPRQVLDDHAIDPQAAQSDFVPPQRDGMH